MYKKEILAFILILLFIITMGYSLINNDISLTSLIKLRKNIWDIPLENIKIDEESLMTNGNVQILQNGNGLNYSVKLEKPGDYYAFDVDIANNGTIDARIENISIGKLTQSQEKYIEYTVTNKDGSTIKKDEIIKAQESKTIHIRICMKEDITIEDFPIEDEHLNLDLDIDIVQK